MFLHETSTVAYRLLALSGPIGDEITMQPIPCVHPIYENRDEAKVEGLFLSDTIMLGDTCPESEGGKVPT